MQKILIPIFLLSIVGCSSNPVQTDKSSLDTDTSKNSNITFPAKPMQILSEEGTGFGADIRLSFTESSTSDRSVIYKIKSTYENKSIGFEMTVPTHGYAKLTFKSSGLISDNFIQLLAKLYKQTVDSTLRFTDLTIADCINMGEYIDSLNKQDGGNYVGRAQYKLILKGDNDGNYGVLYMNIDNNEHWIEITEKNEDYRPAIIALLSKNEN